MSMVKTIPSYTMDKVAIYNQLFNDLGCSNDRDGGMHFLVTTSAYNWANYFGDATNSLNRPTSVGNLVSGLSSEGTPVHLSVDVESTNAFGTNWVGVLTTQTTRIVECYSGRNMVLFR